MKSHTKTIAFVSVLIAIMIIMALTPLGYINVGFAKLTLMCIPVMLGTVLLGVKCGLVLSAVFIVTSILQLPSDPVSFSMFEYMPVVFILTLAVPRLLVPVVTHYVFLAFHGDRPKTSVAVASVAGSLTNTFLYLLSLQVFFVPVLTQYYTLDETAVSAMIWFVVITNGIPEALLAAGINVPLAGALQKQLRLS